MGAETGLLGAVLAFKAYQAAQQGCNEYTQDEIERLRIED